MDFLTNLCALENKHIVLASQSPRRIEMLRAAGLKFDRFPSKFEEELIPGLTPIEYVRHNAAEKGNWVANRTSADIIISADTVVTLDDHIMEKPGDREDAGRMLKLLSGKTHLVVTGFCIIYQDRRITAHEVTEVEFGQLSEKEIEAFLNSGEPFDKAGAYGIQGLAGMFIRKINGCYFNVVGFPLARFYKELKAILK